MKIKPNSKSPLRQTRRWLVGVVAIAALGGIAAVAFSLLSGQETANAQPAIPAGVNLASWYENGSGGEYLLQLAEGEAPPVGVRMSGVVLSDTDCEPDAQGLSHCHNGIALANGSTIIVTDTHLMSRYRCLRPGETVDVTTFNGSWVVATTG
jgi:hypothetical protein